MPRPDIFLKKLNQRNLVGCVTPRPSLGQTGTKRRASSRAGACASTNSKPCQRQSRTALTTEFFILLRLESDGQPALGNQHRALDHGRLGQHQGDGFLFGDALLVGGWEVPEGVSIIPPSLINLASQPVRHRETRYMQERMPKLWYIQKIT
jgi:hypothetical protein